MVSVDEKTKAIISVLVSSGVRWMKGPRPWAVASMMNSMVRPLKMLR